MVIQFLKELVKYKHNKSLHPNKHACWLPAVSLNRGRFTSGFMGFLWRMMTIFFAKLPAVAGEPIANLMLLHRDRSKLNGALFKLYKRADKPDKAMNDEYVGRRLWDELVLLTGLTSE